MNSFISDDEIEKYAQDLDRIYYPLFLESLISIQNRNDRLLFEFISSYKIDSGLNIYLQPLEDYQGYIIPVYKNQTINETGFALNFPIRWNDFTQKDNSWHLYFQTLTWVKPYIESDNKDSLLTGYKIVNDWILAHTVYPDKDEGYAFNDHAASVRMAVLKDTYKKYKKSGILLPEFNKILLLSILSHIFFTGSLEKYNSNTNHGIIMDRQLINVLIDFDEFIRKEDFIRLAFRRVFEIYRKSFTSEGIHKEHSPCYHCWVTNDLNELIEKADTLNILVPDELRIIGKKGIEYTNNLQINGYLPTIGDCSGKKHNSYITNPISTQGIRIYPESGWAFIRDSIFRSVTIIQSDFFSRSHYQQDETSFTLNVNGQDLIIDPGLYSYTPDPGFYTYMRMARAHNLLIVDGKDFDPRNKNTGLSGITRYYIEDENSSSPSGAVELTHPHYNEIGVNVYRQFAFQGGGLYFVNDLAISSEPHLYSQLFHLAPGAEIIKVEKEYIISWKDHPYQLIISSNENDYKVVEGADEPLQGWYFSKFNEVAPSPVLILTKKAASTTFSTIIKVTENESDIKFSEEEIDELKSFIKKLESIERRTLQHQPLPEKWKPARN